MARSNPITRGWKTGSCMIARFWWQDPQHLDGTGRKFIELRAENDPESDLASGNLNQTKERNS